jgi:excisionase family DNA binding protein
MTSEAVDVSGSERWCTVGDAALLVRRSPQTVRNWVRSGRLPVIRTQGGVRLMRPADVLRVAAAHAPHPEREGEIS